MHVPLYDLYLCIVCLTVCVYFSAASVGKKGDSSVVCVVNDIVYI